MNELIPQSTDLRTIKRPNKRQRRFVEYWLTPSSESYCNAYESAVRAGFSDSSARVITGNVRNLQWVQDAKDLYISGIDEDHVMLGLRKEALEAAQPRDRIQAWSKIGEFKGMKVDRSIAQVNVSFTNNVPRPVIEGETTP